MLKDSNNKKWDYVLVYKLDRFSRDKYESAIHRKHLKDNGIILLSAMEKGIYTETTKSRLEELETKRNNLQEKVAIEEAKQQFEMTKYELQNYFASALKQNTEQAIMTFIKCVKVYENKIEIELNNIVNTNYQNPTPTIQKLFTENFTTERLCKGGIIHTKTKPYEVYLVY